MGGELGHELSDGNGDRPDRRDLTEISTFKPRGPHDRAMSDAAEKYCPDCDEEQTFWLTARTELHLGRKRKFRCEECNYGFVTIDGTVDTSATA